MLLNIRFNSILPSTPRSCKWPLSFTFPRRNLTRIFLSSHTCLMTCPSYHDRQVILFGRVKIYQVPHYEVLVCDHSKIHKVPLKHFSLWCTRRDRPVQGTRFVTMQWCMLHCTPRNISAYVLPLFAKVKSKEEQVRRRHFTCSVLPTIKKN